MSKDYTQKQFDRLPKWAQGEINRLKMNLEDAEKRVAEVAGDAETNVYIDDFLRGPTPLPKDCRIKFVDHMGSEYCIRVHRPDEHSKEGIQVSILHGKRRMSGRIVVAPEAANVVTIKADVR